MVQILLNGVADVNQEGFVQRIAIYLLNSLACQVDGKQKTFLGNQGAIGVSFVICTNFIENVHFPHKLDLFYSTCNIELKYPGRALDADVLCGLLGLI